MRAGSPEDTALVIVSIRSESSDVPSVSHPFLRVLKSLYCIMLASFIKTCIISPSSSFKKIN